MLNRTTIATAATTLLLATQAAWADHRDFGETQGTSLRVAQSCARHVAISVDPALSGRVVLSADAANPQEIDQIAASTVDGAARIGLKPGLRECWQPVEHAPFSRTLVLTLRIPAHLDVALEDSGLGDYAIGAIGALSVEESGMTSITAESVTGDVRLDLSGAGTVTLNRVESNRVSASLSGVGTFRVASGRIGDLAVQNSGAASVAITPEVENATLSVSGMGGITVGGVRGNLTRSTSGMGRIAVAGRPAGGTHDDSDEN